MPDIRYVCLSDMHLGSDSSVLTHINPNNRNADFTQPSPVLLQLVTCLRELIAHNESKEKPILILNGDILEMALAETNEAAMVFERFIELLFPPDGEALFDDQNILYIPGNHDHHIWEIARETQYTEFISSVPVGSSLPIPWHTTKMLFPPLIPGTPPSKLVPAYFLNNLIQRHPHLQHAVISVIYPNYALMSSDSQKCVIFSHGHYVESLYTLMSTLNTMLFPKGKKPQDIWDKSIWDLEAENFAWIDFFWSTMGRSGTAGRDIGLIYYKLQDRQQIEMLISTFLRSWLESSHQFPWLKSIEAEALSRIIDFFLGQNLILERKKPVLLSSDALHGLYSFLEGPLLEQIRAENKQNIPPDITFIFGHTHKPFSQDMHFTNYPTWTKVYNSGGWIVDTIQPDSIHGAAAILIDETLQVTSLRLYNQATSASEYTVRAEESTHPGVSSSPFYNRISALVNPSSEPWHTFSQTVAQAIDIRAQLLKTKIDK